MTLHLWDEPLPRQHPTMIHDRGIAVMDDVRYTPHHATHARHVAEYVHLGGWCDALAWEAAIPWRVRLAVTNNLIPRDDDEDSDGRRWWGQRPLWIDRGTYLGPEESTADIARWPMDLDGGPRVV